MESEREKATKPNTLGWWAWTYVRTYYEHKKVTAYGWHDVDILMNL